MRYPFNTLEMLWPRDIAKVQPAFWITSFDKFPIFNVVYVSKSFKRYTNITNTVNPNIYSKWVSHTKECPTTYPKNPNSLRLVVICLWGRVSKTTLAVNLRWPAGSSQTVLPGRSPRGRRALVIDAPGAKVWLAGTPWRGNSWPRLSSR